MRGFFFRVLLTLAVLLTVFRPGVASGQAPEFRAYWVDAFHAGFMSSSQVTTLIDQARAGNFNAVIVEVRKRGDAYYNSNFEPKATDVSPQSYDPLADLIAKAHDTSGGKQRLEVHAWMVTYHIWNPSTATGVPPQANHPYNLHRDWLMKDFNGVSYIGGQYTFDQGHPGVMQHTYNVAMDIVSRYDVDGINFDYVRYSSINEGYNDVSVARFNRLYNQTGKPSPTSATWKQFRRDQITALVRKVYLNTIAIKPHVKVSADTICFAPGVTNLTQWYNSSAAWNSVLQDWHGWMEEGILDLAIPMAYFRQHTVNSNDWAKWSQFAKDFKYNRHVAIGPGIYLNSISNSIAQIRSTRELTPSQNRAEGVSLYSYAVVDTNANAGSSTVRAQQRALFQAALTTNGTSAYDSIAPGAFSTKVNPPVMPWKVSPTRGHLKGFVYQGANRVPIDGATLTLIGPLGKTMTNDGTGFYGAVDLPTGNYSLRANWAGLPPITTNVSIQAGVVRTVDFIFHDTRPPVLSGIRITNITESTATVLWDTDEAATTVVEFGQSPTLGLVFTNGTHVSNHVADLTGLHPCSDYTLRVKSLDGSSNETVSSLMSFSTTPAGFVSDVVVDNTQAQFTGPWTAGTSSADKFGTNYHFAPTISDPATAQAIYRPSIRVPGKYNVYIWYPQGGNRSVRTPIKLSGRATVTTTIDQTSGGGGWRLISAVQDFEGGTNGSVEIANNTGETNRVVMADAFRFEFVAAPCITAHPFPLTVAAGATAEFQVLAQGAPPLRYQWQFNGSNLAGSTASSLRVEHARLADAGDYRATVSNLAGSAASFATRLEVLPAEPVRFLPVELLAGAQLRLSFTGNSNVIYRVEVSSNLVDWASLTNVWSGHGLFEAIDPATNALQFYRAHWIP